MILLREKRNNQLMRQKEIWRSSTNILDSVYDDISKSIPTIDTMEALPIKRGEVKKEAPESVYLKNLERFTNLRVNNMQSYAIVIYNL
ncbi:hypothetical protein QQG55_54745 [Brugia pahangi]